MLDSNVTSAQQAFMDSLQDAVNKQLSSQLGGTFTAINHPTEFPYFDKLPPNNYYNAAMLAVNEAVPGIGSNGIPNLKAQTFSTLYLNLLENVGYDICEADRALIAKDQAAAAAQESAAISSFESNFGPIAQADIAKAGQWATTKIDYITWYVTQRFGGIDDIPPQFGSFKSAWNLFLNMSVNFNKISSRAMQGEALLRAAIAALSGPAAANGGLQVGAASWMAAYTGFPPATKMVAALGTASNEIAIAATVDNFSSTASQLEINGSTGFTLPILDIVDIGFSGGARYDLSKYADSGTTMSMRVVYKGVTTIFGSMPLPLSSDMATGWYSELIIGEVVAKTGNPAVSGLKLIGTEFSVADTFGPGKAFARVRSWVLSQTPTVEITFTGGMASKMRSDFSENTKVDVKLFGLFDVGSVSQSYAVQSVDDKSVAGGFTVTLGPSKAPGSLTPDQETAFIMGGVIDYPEGA